MTANANTTQSPLPSISVFLDTVSFDKHGGWVIDQQFMDEMGAPFLLADGLGEPVKDATTKVLFPQSGTYRVFVRNRDWVGHWKKKNTPEAKRATGSPCIFQVLINGQPLDETFGEEGAEWHWQDGGTVEVDEQQNIISLHDLTGFEGRCEAILFTSELNYIPADSVKGTQLLRKKLLNLPDEPKDAGSFDMTVVGAGIAGICAAVSAARNGLKVALIHDRPIMGGNNSSEVRVWLGGASKGEKYPRIGDILQELEQKDKAHYGPENTAELYEDENKEAVVKAEKNISLFLYHRCNGVEMNQNIISAVIAQDILTGERI